MWQELENRVFKTRFIIQKNFKNLPSLKHGLTLSDRIRSERERVKSERGRPDKRERKSQIREGEKEIARAHPGRATWGSHDPGRATWVARPRPRDLGCATQVAPAWVARPRPPGSRNPGHATKVVRAWVYFFFFVFFFFLPSGSDFFFCWCCFDIYGL